MRLNKKGVSLPELLAVIVIMGIIAMIAIPAFTSMISNTEDNAQLTEIHEVMARTQSYADAEDTTKNVWDRVTGQGYPQYLNSVNRTIVVNVQADYGFTGDVPYFETRNQLAEAFNFGTNGELIFNFKEYDSKYDNIFNFSASGCNTDGTGITVDNFNDKITTACLK